MTSRRRRPTLSKRLLGSRMATALAARIAWLLCKTLRVTVIHNGRRAGAPISNEGVVRVIWHSRLLYLTYMFRWREQTAMVSRSRDGDVISRVVAHLGIRSVRGSTSRGAASAMRTALDKLESGKTLSLTPDGPRGPAGRLQPGCVYLASRAGRPIQPMTYGASRAWRLPSWDRFLIPLPFARVVVIQGDPIHIAAHLTKAELEKARQQVENELTAITRQADAWFTR